MTGSDANLGGLPIAPGDILLKKYRVERLIGEGGTGIVLSATHIQLEQRVAIKFLRRALADDELRTRFEREARAIGKIESDHVVIVLDAGALEDGAPYMVMEYLDGRDLARVLKEDGPLDVEQAVDCMLQVCEALAEAHANGIVHRDLKPANLFLTRRADDQVHVKVVDFGISKILDKKLVEADGLPHEMTIAHAVLGSPRWMAPEQIRDSKDVDGRADLWSVGAVLFQLITGTHAFEAEGNVQASLAVLTSEPRKLRALAPHAPAALEDIVSRCLTKDVTKRFQTAAELARALRPFASERARDSLDQLQMAKMAPSIRSSIGVGPMSSSTLDVGPGPVALPSGIREIPTELSVRVPSPPNQRPADVVGAAQPASTPTSSSKLTLAIVVVGALVVVLGGGVGFKLLGAGRLLRGASSPKTAPAATARFTAEHAPGASTSAPLTVPLDAGERSP
jgi:serine/threonine-protein kinase